MPTYPLYTAVLAKLGARARFYRTDPDQGWIPDLDHLRSLVTPATRALVVIDPNNPTGATYSPATRRRCSTFADQHGLVILADEVYGDLGLRWARGAARQSRSGCAGDFLLEPLKSVSSRQAGARDGWESAARRDSTT